MHPGRLPAWLAPLLLICGGLLGIALPLSSLFWPGSLSPPALWLSLCLDLLAAGALIHFARRSLQREAGIDNDNIVRSAISARGAVAWLCALALTGLYTIIYFGRQLPLGPSKTLHDWMAAHVYLWFSPLSQALRAAPADEWFFYSTLYTFAVLVFAARMLLKYRHNRYQILRTISVGAFQLGFGYMIPYLLIRFQQPEHFFSYFWPLKAEYLAPDHWLPALSQGAQSPALWFLGFGAMMSFVATPLLTMRFGKRWYCSWVCGCGGLAETMGDPFRQLSSKSLSAWRLERWLIHSILAAIVISTAALWINSVSGGKLLGQFSGVLANAYGFYIGKIFAGVIGVGFYPLLGSRVWCRFGCPMAAILGFFQRFLSRFRITTNGGQCISCGNCSTYCEMGIDVRWYAQRGQNIVRSSCVGCGVCAAVCPRGVLRLENAAMAGRLATPPMVELR
ncbi:MAG: 4Fe-4S binding protein [Leptospirales bacterium]|nr:4Fe-4S binding protein [Leptospirales bacterium]